MRASTHSKTIESSFPRDLIEEFVANGWLLVSWIDATKREDKDQEVGIVGYEIPFNRYFYEYKPPRELSAIDADIAVVSQEIIQLLQEVCA